MSEKMTGHEAKEKSQSLVAFALSLSGKELGTIGFNLCALGWICLSISLQQQGPAYLPGSFVNPNCVNILGGYFLAAGTALSALAIYRLSLIPAAIALTFSWAFIATVVRAMFQ